MRRDQARRSRRWRTLAWSLVTLLVVLIVVGLGAVGWIFSNDILVPKPYGLQSEFDIVSATSDTVTLPLPPNENQFADTRKDGLFTLIWDGGVGMLGTVIEENETALVRGFEPLRGELPAAGTAARLDAYLYRGLDPLSAHGLPFEDLMLTGEVGQIHAWWLPAEGDTAVLMLHGRRRGDLSETLRMMPVLVDEGYPLLALSYRNHDRSSLSPDGLYHYGETEWRDLLTGLAFLREQGIERAVIYAYSYGGAITLEAIEALRNDPALSGVEVVALVLDSPFLDSREVFRQGARNLNLPLPEQIADLATWVARLRAGIAWRDLDQRLDAGNGTLPLLLIHGAEDRTIPVGLSDTFARDYGGFVDYHRVDGADHVESWNVDPDAYQGWVRAFLDRYAP
jgi:pimeloyl-ACP methyl ester carboxylesterase